MKTSFENIVRSVPEPEPKAPITPDNPWGLSPEDFATKFGSGRYRYGTNPNDKGSGGRAVDAGLAKMTPEQLLLRYSTPGVIYETDNSVDYKNKQAYDTFNSLVGRAPTGSEFLQILPSFQQDPTLGKAQIAAIADRLAQDPNNAQNKKKADTYYDAVNSQFKNLLGRDATSDEKSHFGALLATNNLDAYGLGQFLQGSSEYQGQQNQKFQNELGTKLQQTDLNFFNKAKQSVMSQFLQNGTASSSALDSALTELMGQIADRRSEFMGNLSANQYGSNQNLAIGNYKSAMDKYLSDQNYNRALNQKQMDYYSGRNDELSDYNRQKNDYMDFLSKQDKGGNRVAGTLGGALGGAGAMAPLGPWGALGGGLGGGLLGYLNSK